jgi:hypothetical protein
VPNEATPTVERMILSMKTEKKWVAHIARELNLLRQTGLRGAAGMNDGCRKGSRREIEVHFF